MKNYSKQYYLNELRLLPDVGLNLELNKKRLVLTALIRNDLHTERAASELGCTLQSLFKYKSRHLDYRE